MGDRVVDEDRHELAEPERVAEHGRRLRVEQHLHVPLGGQARHGAKGFAGDVRQVERLALELDDAGIRSGEQEQVPDERREVLDFVPDVAERIADGGDGLVSMALEVLDARADDREGRPELVAGVGRELALAADRLADRHERAAGVDRAGDDRAEQAEEATGDEHDEEDLERAVLARRVLGDLDDVRAARRLDRLAEDPERHAAEDHVTDVGRAGSRDIHAALVGQAVRTLRRPEDVTVRIRDVPERPGRRPADGKDEGGAAVTRAAERPGEASLDPVRASLELVAAVGRERARRGRVQGRAEERDHEDGRARAPRDEPPADALEHLRIGRRGAAADQGPSCGRLPAGERSAHRSGPGHQGAAMR